LAGIRSQRVQGVARLLRDQTRGDGCHCTRRPKTYSGCGWARASQPGTAPTGGAPRGWPPGRFDPRRLGQLADVVANPRRRDGFCAEGNDAHVGIAIRADPRQGLEQAREQRGQQVACSGAEAWSRALKRGSQVRTRNGCGERPLSVGQLPLIFGDGCRLWVVSGLRPKALT